MITEINDALVYDDRFSRIERRLAVLSWQLNATSAVIVAAGLPSIWLLLGIASKVGAL